MITVTTIALARPSYVLSDEGMESLVSAAYFPRALDPALHDIAHQRAVEVSTDWSHNGMRAGTAEVLAYNSGFSDPVSKAISQWQGSPDHHSILSSETYTRIGCGSHFDGTTHWFACVLAADIEQPAPEPAETEPSSGGGGVTPVAPPSTSGTPPPAPSQQPVTLPDTRMP